MPKLDLLTLKRTNLGFPAEWEAKTTEGQKVYLHFRYGNLSVYIDDNLHIKEPKDEFCLEGIISDEELLVILERLELIDDSDKVSEAD